MKLIKVIKLFKNLRDSKETYSKTFQNFSFGRNTQEIHKLRKIYVSQLFDAKKATESLTRYVNEMCNKTQEAV